MAKRVFLIQGASSPSKYFLPAHDFGFACIKAIEHENRYGGEDYDYRMVRSIKLECNKRDIVENPGKYIPVGSNEFVHEFLALYGTPEPKPLNVPAFLFPRLCRRAYYGQPNEEVWQNPRGWFIKDADKVKGVVDLSPSMCKPTKNYFISERIENIVSEWRVFVMGGEVRGIRCYQGDEFLVPTKSYIDGVAKTLTSFGYPDISFDVAVAKKEVFNGHKVFPHLIEVHDFYSCGLYGFNQPRVLLFMWVRTILRLLKQAR